MRLARCRLRTLSAGGRAVAASKTTGVASLAQSTLCLGSVVAPGRFARGMAERLQRNTPRLIYVAVRPSRLFGTNLRHRRSDDAIRGCHKKVILTLVYVCTSPPRQTMFAWNTRVASHDRDVVCSQVALTSLHFHLRTLTSADLPLTSPHPHICTSISHLYIHTVAPSHLSCLSIFLHIFSLVYIFARSHPQIYLYTAPYIYVFYIAPAHPHCHPFTSTLSFSVSIYIFSTVLDNHMSRSRATRRLVLQFLIIRASCSKSPQHMSHV